MKLPAQVRVGWRTYRIARLNPIEARARGAFGQCDKLRGIIKIDTSLSADQRQNSILHEILHAIWDERELASTCAEETAVANLTAGLCAFVKDNPEVVADWLKTLQAIGNRNKLSAINHTTK